MVKQMFDLIPVFKKQIHICKFFTAKIQGLGVGFCTYRLSGNTVLLVQASVTWFLK